MTRQTLLYTAIGVTLAVGGIALWRSPALSEEDKVRAAITAISDGAKEADVAATLEPISKNYRGEENTGHPEIAAFLYGQFRRSGPISAWLGPINVTINKPEAHADFDAVLADWDGGILPANADGWHFEVDLMLEEGTWRVVSHTREGLDGVPDGYVPGK